MNGFVNVISKEHRQLGMALGWSATCNYWYVVAVYRKADKKTREKCKSREACLINVPKRLKDSAKLTSTVLKQPDFVHTAGFKEPVKKVVLNAMIPEECEPNVKDVGKQMKRYSTGIVSTITECHKEHLTEIASRWQAICEAGKQPDPQVEKFLGCVQETVDYFVGKSLLNLGKAITLLICGVDNDDFKTILKPYKNFDALNPDSKCAFKDAPTASGDRAEWQRCFSLFAGVPVK